MKTQIPDFSHGQVLVFGDLMLDKYWHGATSRISPEAPVPVVKVEQIDDRAGGAGNVALNLARLGCRVELLGLVGEDDAAAQLEQLLSREQITCIFSQVKGKQTITKLRVMSRHQQLIRLDFEDGFVNTGEQSSLHAYQKALSTSQVVVLSDYNKGCLRDPLLLIDLAIKAGKKVVVDPKGADFDKYRNATLLTPNQSEFEAVVGVCEDESALVAKGEQLREQLNLQALLITRSEKGMVLIEKGQPPFIQPTRAKDVFDVTGAGDTVISALAAALSVGNTLVESVQLANLAAGVAVAKMGTATVSVAELQSAMLEHLPLQSGVVSEENLRELIKTAQASGERVVMTNGCFDILHAGHVAYLAEAAALGDRLVVAVNSDASVKQLKGATRPINALNERMQVLAALASVDWVVDFNEETPQRLIANCLPNILVKGGDYNVEDIAGAEDVLANGGRVEVLSFVNGCSTSAVIDKINKA